MSATVSETETDTAVAITTQNDKFPYFFLSHRKSLSGHVPSSDSFPGAYLISSANNIDQQDKLNSRQPTARKFPFIVRSGRNIGY